MAVQSDVEVSDVIVSVANAVSQANDALNQDPRSSVAITRFEVDVSVAAVLSVPTKVARTRFRLTRVTGERFRLAEVTFPRVEPARFQGILQPSFLEAVLPATRTQTSQVEIRAVIEAVPGVQEPA